jgi:hypothetical protein
LPAGDLFQPFDMPEEKTGPIAPTAFGISRPVAEDPFKKNDVPALDQPPLGFVKKMPDLFGHPELPAAVLEHRFGKRTPMAAAAEIERPLNFLPGPDSNEGSRNKLMIFRHDRGGGGSGR